MRNLKTTEMTVEAYITQSRTEGKVITNEYVNGVDYTLITEPDLNNTRSTTI